MSNEQRCRDVRQGPRYTRYQHQQLPLQCRAPRAEEAVGRYSQVLLQAVVELQLGQSRESVIVGSNGVVCVHRWFNVDDK